jgi:hypothetical protein
MILRLVTPLLIGTVVAVGACSSSDADDDGSSGGNADGGKTDGGKTDGGKTDGGGEQATGGERHHAAQSGVGDDNALFDLPDLLLDLRDGLLWSPVWPLALAAEEYDGGCCVGLSELLLWSD